MFLFTRIPEIFITFRDTESIWYKDDVKYIYSLFQNVKEYILGNMTYFVRLKLLLSPTNLRGKIKSQDYLTRKYEYTDPVLNSERSHSLWKT
jgi:hypothetical protein